jgi:GTPase involved in cell partitioning and DNA repair
LEYLDKHYPIKEKDSETFNFWLVHHGNYEEYFLSISEKRYIAEFAWIEAEKQKQIEPIEKFELLTKDLVEYMKKLCEQQIRIVRQELQLTNTEKECDSIRYDLNEAESFLSQLEKLKT